MKVVGAFSLEEGKPKGAGNEGETNSVESVGFCNMWVFSTSLMIPDDGSCCCCCTTRVDRFLLSMETVCCVWQPASRSCGVPGRVTGHIRCLHTGPEEQVPTWGSVEKECGSVSCLFEAVCILFLQEENVNKLPSINYPSQVSINVLNLCACSSRPASFTCTGKSLPLWCPPAV